MIDLKKLCIGLWTIAAVLNGCESQYADAQIFMVKTEVRACTPINCRVEVGTGSSFCVGHIGERYYFVTAGHCCYAHGAGMIGSKLLSAHVAIDQQWVPARVDGFDRTTDSSDIAVLSLVPGKTLHALPIAERVPPVGSQVTIGGFPSGSPYAEVTGNILPAQTGDRQTDYLVSTAVVRGVSGGPVMHNGEAVGVVSASDFGSGTWIVGPEKVRAKLTQLLGRLPDCGKPRPTVPPQSEEAEKEPEPFKRDEKSLPPVPPAVEPSGIGQAAGAVASSAWTYLWPALAGALGLSGPLGIGVYMAGRIIASRLAPRVVERVQDRLQASGSRLQERQASPAENPKPDNLKPEARIQYVPVQVPVEKHTEVPVPVHVPVPTTQNRYVDVPVMNSEAEALKEAMRLEAEFSRTDNPAVSQHLRRVQDMADMILKGQKIEKPGWKL